jgi:predicted nucleic acid-binding Zn finger protein
MALTVMAGWETHLMDIHGALLKGKFKDREVIYMKILQEFKEYYKEGKGLQLLRTIYGLKQAAVAFWHKVISAFEYMGYKRSTANPCLYYK